MDIEIKLDNKYECVFDDDDMVYVGPVGPHENDYVLHTSLVDNSLSADEHREMLLIRRGMVDLARCMIHLYSGLKRSRPTLFF